MNNTIPELSKYEGHKPKILSLVNEHPNGMFTVHMMDYIPLSNTVLISLCGQLENEGKVKIRRVGQRVLVLSTLSEKKIEDALDTVLPPAATKETKTVKPAEKEKTSSPSVTRTKKDIKKRKPLEAPLFERKGEGKLNPYTPRRINSITIRRENGVRKAIIRAEGKRSITVFAEDMYAFAEKLLRLRDYDRRRSKKA